MTTAPETTPTVSASDSKTSSSGPSPVITAVAVTLFLSTVVGFSANAYYTNLVENKRGTFEKVLNMPTSELEMKSASELNDYRKEIESGARMSPLIGNVTGYDGVIVERELKRVNDLILKKTAH